MLQHRDGRVRVYRRKNKRFANNCVVEVDRTSGGSVMMWGAISYNQRTSLVLVTGNLTAQRYHDKILQPHILPVINTERERFFSTTTPDHTQNVLLSTFLLTTTSLCYPGHQDPWISIQLNTSWISWINVCAGVNQPRKLFCNYSRHYTRNGKEYPRSKFNVRFSQCGDELQQFCKQTVATQDTDVIVQINVR